MRLVTRLEVLSYDVQMSLLSLRENSSNVDIIVLHSLARTDRLAESVVEKRTRTEPAVHLARANTGHHELFACRTALAYIEWL